MRTRFLRGNTAENNGLTLPEGEISVDEETKAVRLHDGVTPGGFELVGTRAYEPLVGPGPEQLIAGTTEAGFYGEVDGPTDLLTYGDLSSAIGLSAGNLINDSQSKWLKFSYLGEILYVAKTPARDSVSWNHINAAGAVYSGQSNITIGNNTFDVTLIKGGNADPSSAAGGEWNQLIYPVHYYDINDNNWNIGYTDVDLHTSGNEPGRQNWCQETISGYPDRRVQRGYSISYYVGNPATGSGTHTGWRPVLRLQS